MVEEESVPTESSDAEAASYWVAIGDCARDRREWMAARASYEKAVSLDPKLGAIWIQLGHAAKESGDPEAAERAYRTALDINPHNADGHLQFGHLMKISGRHHTAMVFYRHAWRLDCELKHAQQEIKALIRNQSRLLESGVKLPPHFSSDPSEGDNVFPPVQRLLGGPDFMCIGMARAGTGWLFDQLRCHPDFWMPPVKELGYLKREERGLKKHISTRMQQVLRNGSEHLHGWSNRRPGDQRDIAFLQEAKCSFGNPQDLASYACLYRFKENFLSGDITPGYVRLNEGAIARIAEAFPRLKVMLMVRDPAERAWSRFGMWVRLGIVPADLLDDPTRFRDFLGSSRRLAEESFPTRIIAQWRRAAPDLAFRWFLFDGLVENSDTFRRDILLYLGGDPEKKGAGMDTAHNKKAEVWKPELTPQLKAALAEHFREELFACADMFGGVARGWPTRYGF